MVSAPLPLVLYDGIYLKSVVSIYYGDVNIYRVSPAQAKGLEESLGPGERVFRYSGYD